MDAIERAEGLLEATEKTGLRVDIELELLLDIARSMRRQTQLAEEGLKFSQSLAKLFETPQ